jgi:hypothetical protein
MSVSLAVGYRLCCLLAILFSVAGCAVRSSTSGAPEVPPFDMTPVQQQWANHLIANFYPPAENVLPQGVSSVNEILGFMKKTYPTFEVLERSVHKNFLFLPLRTSPDQRLGDEQSLMNVIVLDLHARTYMFVLGSKS